MEKDVLSQVIEVEKELQKCLEAEKVKAREWLEGVKKECEEEFLLEEKKIKQTLEQSLAEAMKQAEVKAAEIMNQAAAAVGHLEQLKMEDLIGIIERQVAKILPG